VARTGGGLVRVFYCLWEDRSADRNFDAAWLGARERLHAVLHGQRNSGQRSLELAVWGVPTQEEAEAAFSRVLNRILRTGD